MDKSDVKLKWALIDGVLRDVSTYAELHPCERPEAYCPMCQQPIIMKLGKIRAPHCAHLPDSVCAATNPETALHLNLKYHIAHQLEQADKLLIQQGCQEEYCETIRIVVWQQGWDQIAVEYQIDTFRPDIALLRGQKEFAAIEVHVTNQVSQDKAAYLYAKGIPIIEVPGIEDLYTGEDIWTFDKPLPYENLFPELSSWQCEECRRRKRKVEERARLEEYRRNHFSYGHCSRLVDFYYPSGKKYREWYFINIVVRNGKKVEATLKSRGSKKPIAVIKGEINEKTIQDLQAPFMEHVHSNRPQGTIIDMNVQLSFFPDRL